MRTNYELRYAAHPDDARHYDTQRLRRDFLVERLFADDEVQMVYSMYDRMVVGGAMPVREELTLEAIEPLKAPYFTTRREVGLYNVGGPGVVVVGSERFELDFKEALYIGRGDRDVHFSSVDEQHPAKFYFNSTTAHASFPCRKVTKQDAIVAKEKEAADLKKKYFGPDGELFKKRTALMTPIQDEIYNAVKDIAELRGYQLILDRASDAGIIFGSPKIDISSEVLRKLGYSN